MPENTADFDIPKPLLGDTPPHIETATHPAFDRIDELLGAIDLSQLVVPESSDGKFLIVKDGAAAYKTMSGDGTIDEDGNFQLGPKVVGTGELGDKAVTGAKVDNETLGEGKFINGSVTSPKFKPTAGIVMATAQLALVSAEYKDVPGAKLDITPSVASLLLAIPTFSFNVNSNGENGAGAYGTLRLDGVDQSPFIHYGLGGGAQVWLDISLSRPYLLSLTAGEKHTIKMRAKKQPPGVATVEAEEKSGFFYMLLAS